MTVREGPKVSIKATCFGCVHERSESYAVQGDSGHDVSCAHPGAPDKGRIGDTRWDTPEWCPFLHVEIDKLVRSRASQPK